jgi:hypothetical protein
VNSPALSGCHPHFGIITRIKNALKFTHINWNSLASSGDNSPYVGDFVGAEATLN